MTNKRTAEPNGKSNHQLHDKGYKKLFSNKEIFLEFLQTFVKEDWVRDINTKNLVRMDKEYILEDYRKKEADIVYEMKFKNPITGEEKEAIFYILFELQSSVDRLMPYRLLMYMVQIWKYKLGEATYEEAQGKDYKLPAIVPIVLYNGSQQWDAVMEFKDLISEADRFTDWLVNFRYILVDVDQYNKEELLRISNAISLVIMMDQTIVAKDKKILITRLEQIVETKDKLPPEKIELLYEWIREVLLERFPVEEGFKIIEYMREGRSMTYAIDRLFDNLEEKAKKEGREEGRKEGVVRMVENAIKKGMRVEDIIEFTDLTMEDIEKIRREM